MILSTENRMSWRRAKKNFIATIIIRFRRVRWKCVKSHSRKVKEATKIMNQKDQFQMVFYPEGVSTLWICPRWIITNYSRSNSWMIHVPFLWYAEVLPFLRRNFYIRRLQISILFNFLILKLYIFYLSHSSHSIHS